MEVASSMSILSSKPSELDSAFKLSSGARGESRNASSNFTSVVVSPTASITGFVTSESSKNVSVNGEAGNFIDFNSASRSSTGLAADLATAASPETIRVE